MIGRIKQWLQGEGRDEAALESRPGSRVLMVCTGNICRSPTAEGVLRSKLRKAGLQGAVLVDSAGTHGYHTSEPPDPRAIKHAAQRGYDIAGQRARPVVPEDFERFHWLLAMDEANLAWLQKRAPANNTARIELLMPYALHHPQMREVPDPYYGVAAGFEQVLDLVEDACEGVLRRLQAQENAGRQT